MRLLPLLLVSSCLTAHAANWPQWRGPAGNGVSTEEGVPVNWSEDSLAWSVDLRGLGVSSPVVWGDKVFVTYQIGAGKLRPGNHPSLVQGGDPIAAGETPLGGTRAASNETGVTFVLAAFNTSTGDLLWETVMAHEGEFPEVHEKANMANPSPTTDGELIYAWFASGQLMAVDMDGAIVWKRNLGSDLGAFDIGWGHSSSPAIYNDKLVLICYQVGFSTLLALDKKTGKDIWRQDREAGVISYSTPLFVDAPSGKEMIVNSGFGVEAFNPDTGEKLWLYEEPSRFPIPAPIHRDGVIYLNRGYRSSPYMALRVGGRGNVAETHIAWRSATGGPYISSLVEYDGLLYMANDTGILTCIDAATGERVWQERLGGVFSASPVVADGKIYFSSETGEMLVLKAGRTAEVLARNKLRGHTLASPAISDGKIFIRFDNRLVAVAN
jgi:outer membrane protein assembly factor BamB